MFTYRRGFQPLLSGLDFATGFETLLPSNMFSSPRQTYLRNREHAPPRLSFLVENAQNSERERESEPSTLNCLWRSVWKWYQPKFHFLPVSISAVLRYEIILASRTVVAFRSRECFLHVLTQSRLAPYSFFLHFILRVVIRCSDLSRNEDFALYRPRRRGSSRLELLPVSLPCFVLLYANHSTPTYLRGASCLISILTRDSPRE